MQDAKGATGEAKTEAEDRCRTAILALWRHRTELNEPRPLQSADEIIRAIRGLYDDEGRWFFFLDEPEKPADQMIEIARRVNEGARTILRYFVAASFLQKTEAERHWYEDELIRIYKIGRAACRDRVCQYV